jgi:dipeptidyl aminopeptidase/acylaminoacyl peptidase
MLLGGNDDTHSSAYSAASPSSYVSMQTVPSLILHGKNDTLIPYTEALRFGALLQSNGVSSDVLILENAGHGDFGPNPDLAIQKLVAFIKGAGPSR